MSTIVERISAAWLVHKREPLANAADLGWPTKDAPFALRAKHESRPRRKTVFDGLRASLVGGLVNKFPVRQKCTAARFAPFVGPDTKSLTASRKRPLRGLHEKSGCRRSNCDPLISCHFVSGEARFVSVEAEAQMGRGKGTALRGGLSTGAWAGLAARRRSRPPTMTVFVFRAERRVADKFWFHPTNFTELTESA